MGRQDRNYSATGRNSFWSDFPQEKADVKIPGGVGLIKLLHPIIKEISVRSSVLALDDRYAEVQD